MKKGKVNEVSSSEVLVGQSHDMPMLENIISNCIYEIQRELSATLDITVNLNLESTLQLTCKEYIELFNCDKNHISTSISIANFNGNPLYFVTSKDFIYKLIEISLGGRNINSNLRVQDRDFSKIEQTIIDNLFLVIRAKLQDAFRVVDNKFVLNKSSFNYNRAEIKFDRPINIVLSRIIIAIKDSVTKLDIVIPYDALLPMKSSLIKPFSNNKLIQSDLWSRHLANFLLQNEVKLTVEIAVDQPLSIIQNIKVGDVIITDREASEAFDLSINGVKIYQCKIGKMSEKIAAELIDKGM
jgi:flagellar motor switch protein FliM